MSEANRMSLVPYVPEHAREIILRHESTVVVYDQRSRQLSLREVLDSNGAEISACPTCHRPWQNIPPQERARSPNRSKHDDDDEEEEEETFMNPSYFRMLQYSTANTPQSSRPPSPIRGTKQSENPIKADFRPPPGTKLINSEASPKKTNGISTAAFSPDYFNKFFTEERELGRGGKGVVLLVRHAIDGVYLGHFACKRVPVGDDHGWLEKVLVEVQLLQNLSHQNLVSYRHVWLENYQITTFSPSVPCAFILQQYCNGGDLQNHVLDPTTQEVTTEQMKDRMRRRSKGKLEEPVDLRPRKLQFEQIFSFFRDIASGLHHLHSSGYIHRDLKPSNCLLHKTGGEIRVLVSDYGEVQREHVTRLSTGATGTIAYCAPEVLRKDTNSPIFGNFTTKSDVFSLGMIVYFMCFGRLPYSSADDINNETEDLDELREEVASWAGVNEDWKSQSNLPDKLYHALKSLLAVHPHDRPSTEEILRAMTNNNRGVQVSDDHVRSPRPEQLYDRSRISSADSPSPFPYRNKSNRTQLTRSIPGFAPPGPSRLRAVSPNDKQSPISSATAEVAVMSQPQKDESLAVDLQTTMTRSGRNSPEHVTSHRPPSPFRKPLALPAPPYRHDTVTRMVVLLRMLIFVAKYASLTLPCAPLAASTWVSAPVMLLAALDFDGILKQTHESRFNGLHRSLLFLLLHIIVLLVVRRMGELCSGRALLLVDDNTMMSATLYD